MSTPSDTPNMKLTPEHFDEAERLHLAATKGPFTVSDDDCIEVQREGVHIARFPTTESFPCLDSEYDDLNAIAAELKANADFYAFMRNHGPDAFRELKAARERIAELEKAQEECK